MGGHGIGSKKGSGLLIVAVLLVLQLATWRGRSRLAITSYDGQGSNEWQKRSMDTQPLADTTTADFTDYDGPELDAQQHKKKRKDTHHDGKHGKDKSPPHSTSTTKAVPSTSTSHPSTSSSTSTSAQSSSTSITYCKPLPTDSTPLDLCLHVRAHCPPTGHIDYLRFFYCIGLDIPPSAPEGPSIPFATRVPLMQRTEGSTSIDSNDGDARQLSSLQGITANVKALRASALALIVAWMLFLFSWVGIVASDFFCPNLSTLAARLGLSESTAGVTFLAFGNGSPDVFSTFGAMRTGSGSLAIGELIGAASFIVSVISGSMMLIAPFRVKAFPFLRDVGFFTIAVAMTLAFLFDGNLRFGECVSLIALYVAYAATVIIGSWWQERRRLHKLRIASIRSENSVDGGVQHDAYSDAEGQFAQGRTSPFLPPMSAIEYEPDVDPLSRWVENTQLHPSGSMNGNGRLTPQSAHSGQASPMLFPVDLPTSSSATSSNARLQRFRTGILARHSLLGAVEFRDVVENLRKESSADRSMEIYQSRDPERFLPHPQHVHHHSQSSAIEGSPSRRHSRTKSLNRPQTRRFHSQSDANIRSSLMRSRSTIGASAEAGPLADVERPTLEQIGPSSRLAAAAAAVGDPWREHDAGDGCEDILPLPPSAMPLVDDTSTDQEHGLQNGKNDSLKMKPTLPRLLVRQATAPLEAEDETAVANASLTRRMRQSKRGSASFGNANRRADFRSIVKSTRRALFPSLRHLREKSWLGLAIGVITAPALFLLNLTLPVVDDEAESSLMGEKHSTYSASLSRQDSGRIRLEGPEASLQAHRPSAYLAVDHDDDEADTIKDLGRGEIDLSHNAAGSNPWDASADDIDDERRTEANRRDNLEVAAALRHLTEDASPLLTGERSSKQRLRSTSQQHSDELESNASEDSCASRDSHYASQESRLLIGLAQCVFAPPFCVWAITSSARSKHVLSKTLVALFGGMLLATLAFLVAIRLRSSERYRRGLSPSSIVVAVGWARVAMGFFVSILYIMTIVDEVVSILQTLGIVLGLSDAILGLTVFAMGNSLGDLVANITIARMGHPVMAISACFAGPLLNLLLGIGISGSWLLSGHHQPSVRQSSLSSSSFGGGSMDVPGVYHIDFSPTLTVSGCGLLVILLGTLVCVPLNGFYLNRTIGTSLIMTYVVIMCVNIGVEIYNL